MSECKSLAEFTEEKLSSITAELGGICDISLTTKLSTDATTSSQPASSWQHTTAGCENLAAQKQALDECSQNIMEDFEIFTEEDWLNEAMVDNLCK